MPPRRLHSFRLEPGDAIGHAYVVEARLGKGWEGEVFQVVERRTGVVRAAKLFFPQRNVNDRAVRWHARKLERLRDCPVIVKYHHTEHVEVGGHRVTALISEFVEGEILDALVKRQPGRRLGPFEALHLVHALAAGLEDVHAQREYHGDVHSGNVLVRRRGIRFATKLIDLYNWGPPSAANIREDVINVIRILYDAVGGAERYARQPPEIKHVCAGLRRDIIGRRFPSAAHLRRHLERFEWESR